MTGGAGTTRNFATTRDYPAVFVSLPEKKCTRCEAVLPSTSFRRHVGKKDGLDSWCRSCHSASTAAWRERNRPAILERRRREYAESNPNICKRCGKAEATDRRAWHCAPCKAVVKRARNNRPDSAWKKAKRQGYGRAHRMVRLAWKPRVDAGIVKCARCGEVIPPGEPWDMGHDDFDRSKYSGPEHRRCNRATAAHRVRKKSRAW